ncbi:MAG: ATP-binding protein [Bacillus sp. (in: Bacteria)]|nr:ATP-binding protein [Bacillus sp. (in: firmicutes)]
MPKGGNIHIDIFVEERKLTVSITDEGKGIPKETLKKIGQPFYTTKENGNGLGIVVTQRIVEAHEGTFSIDSEEGIGTTVKLTLPVNKVKKKEPLG